MQHNAPVACGRVDHIYMAVILGALAKQQPHEAKGILMTRGNIVASTSLVFILGLAACAPTPSAPPPVAPQAPAMDQPSAESTESMENGTLPDDMGADPMQMN